MHEDFNIYDFFDDDDENDEDEIEIYSFLITEKQYNKLIKTLNYHKSIHDIMKYIYGNLGT